MSEPPLKVTAEGVEAEPRKIGHRYIDFIVAGTAILISLISLVVAIQHGKIMERLVAANSWPLLHYSSSNLDDRTNLQTITMDIENEGVGPAIVRSFSASYRGKRYVTPEAFLKDCCGYSSPDKPIKRFEPGGVISSDVQNTVIRAGEKVSFLKLQYTDQNQPVWSRLDRARFEVSVDACYCSVFGECWRSDLGGVDPVPVDQCPAPARNDR